LRRPGESYSDVILRLASSGKQNPVAGCAADRDAVHDRNAQTPAIRRRLGERAKSTQERNRSRGSRGEGRQEVLKAEDESEGSDLSQDRGVQPHARQKLSRCPTNPSARCVSA